LAVGTGDEQAILLDLIGVTTETPVGSGNWVYDDDGSVGSYTSYDGGDGADWVSVFGQDNVDVPVPTNGANVAIVLHDDDEKGTCADCPGVTGGNRDNPGIHVNASGDWITKTGDEEWLGLFGDTPLASQYQDGHFVYQVVPGGKTGDDTYPPVLYVADIENASHFNNVLEP